MNRVGLQYYKREQALAKLIKQSLSAKIDVDFAHDLSVQLNDLMRGVDAESCPQLIDGAVMLSDWLDDFDIRARDAEYALRTNDRLINWLKEHADET
jgi:HEPN domain-containing protein